MRAYALTEPHPQFTGKATCLHVMVLPIASRKLPLGLTKLFTEGLSKLINEHDIKHLSEDQKLCLDLAEEAGVDTTYMNMADIKSLSRFMKTVAEQCALVSLEHQQFNAALDIREFFKISTASRCALLRSKHAD